MSYGYSLTGSWILDWLSNWIKEPTRYPPFTRPWHWHEMKNLYEDHGTIHYGFADMFGALLSPPDPNPYK